MSKQPEALRLAAELSKSHLNHHVNHAAAAELRRLNEEVETNGTIIQYHEASIARLTSQRDALLEALKLIANTNPVDAALDPQRAVRIARVAIAKAEENT